MGKASRGGRVENLLSPGQMGEQMDPRWGERFDQQPRAAPGPPNRAARRIDAAWRRAGHRHWLLTTTPSASAAAPAGDSRPRRPWPSGPTTPGAAPGAPRPSTR